jgi:hypothetical protein
MFGLEIPMKHVVQFTVPKRDLGKSDVVFSVNIDGEKLGTLEVSKGSVVWYRKNNSYGHKVGWSEFDRIMDGYPRVEKR